MNIERRSQQDVKPSTLGNLVIPALLLMLGVVGLNELTKRDNQVSGIPLVDCEYGPAQNELNFTTLVNRGEPLRIGGRRNFVGVIEDSLNVKANGQGGLIVDIPSNINMEGNNGMIDVDVPQEGEPTYIKGVEFRPNDQVIVFNSNGVNYEISYSTQDPASTAVSIKASCES